MKIIRQTLVTYGINDNEEGLMCGSSCICIEPEDHLDEDASNAAVTTAPVAAAGGKSETSAAVVSSMMEVERDMGRAGDVVQACSKRGGSKREELISVDELVSVEDQIDKIGFGRFQLIAITAFISFKIADGMELATGNVIWRLV
jgi:hypothetical protein